MGSFECEKKQIEILKNWKREHKLQVYQHQIRLILPSEWIKGTNYSRVQIEVGRQENGETFTKTLTCLPIQVFWKKELKT